MQTIDCDHCGKQIKAATKRKLYCSLACKQASYRNRNSTPTQIACDDTTGPSDAPTGLQPYVYPERVLQTDGPTPGALQGDDYPLTYDADGFPELPACLDRRKPLAVAA